MKVKFVSCFLAAILVIAAMFFIVKINYPTKYYASVEKYSSQYNLPKSLVFSVIKCESSFNKEAISSKGAQGLMQIMPSTAKYIAGQLNQREYSLKNADDNIKFGCFYLNYLMSKFNNLQLVIYAYNCGEGRVFRYLKGENLPVETINYYNRVMRVKKVYDLIS